MSETPAGPPENYDPLTASTNQEAERREREAETPQQPSEKPLRYALQRGASGTFNVQRRVNSDCDDFEDEHGPVTEYWDTVCICSSPYTALHIATALQREHPDGNIT